MRAIKRMKIEHPSDKSFDEKDEEQITEYQQLRRLTDRVTPDRFKLALTQKRVSFDTKAGHHETY